MVIMLHETWFGISEANQHYIDTADALPGVIATLDGDAVGITTVKRHSPYAAEIYLMAVKPAHHRHGVGRRLHRDRLQQADTRRPGAFRPQDHRLQSDGQVRGR